MDKELKKRLFTHMCEVKCKDMTPSPDIAICSECGWRGPVSECGTDYDGDWESGYYPVDLCPKCEDGGCIDDYDMSPERLAEYEAWVEKEEIKDEQKGN